MDGRTTDRLWCEINIPFFSKEKNGYKDLVTQFQMSASGPLIYIQCMDQIFGLMTSVQ